MKKASQENQSQKLGVTQNVERSSGRTYRLWSTRETEEEETRAEGTARLGLEGDDG